jgi:hypothetical protein
MFKKVVSLFIFVLVLSGCAAYSNYISVDYARPEQANWLAGNPYAVKVFYTEAEAPKNYEVYAKLSNLEDSPSDSWDELIFSLMKSTAGCGADAVILLEVSTTRKDGVMKAEADPHVAGGNFIYKVKALAVKLKYEKK